MERYPTYTRDRLKLLTGKIRELIYPDIRPLDQISVSGPVDRISYAEAQKLTKWKPAKLGDQFGPLWSTYWFRLKATVPAEWKGRRVDLLWGSHSEGTLWVNGRSIQGLNHEPAAFDLGARPDAVLLEKAKGDDPLDFQVEMACNRMFGYGLGNINTYANVSPFVLDQAQIALFDEDAWDLYHDFLVLQSLEAEQLKDLDKSWGGELLSELNRFANEFDQADRSTWGGARRMIKALYKRTNGTKVHELSAIGHAHIDTAWLWPLAETHRKCERTFSTQATYMDSYPEYKFSCSQAVQYKWIKQRNPDLYGRIKKKVKAGQWVPVGGTWVEPDCNIPSGEALIRQFLFGQRFFEKEFGVRCKEFWNPDVFGYNGQLPQICNLAGIKRFLTQKLSWNRFNKPHHHTFIWEGIDGSEVVTHFPPADTYNAMVSVEELRENARNYKDHDRSGQSILLFGYGDGGGGPTKRMLETLRRVKDLEGLPRTEQRSSNDFFDRLEKDCNDWPRLIGELYFEYHRGTYTTQANAKRGNRRSEFLLHDVEFLSAVAAKTGKYKYPTQAINALWETVLVNQFHDILPGSSIELVYEDNRRDYEQVERIGAELRDKALQVLAGDNPKGARGLAVVNTIGFDRAEVVRMPNGAPAYVEAPSYGTGAVADCPDSVTIIESGRGWVMENTHLRAELTRDGKVRSLLHRATGREALAAPGNQLLFYKDEPLFWAAWDVDPFHMETETQCPPAESAEVVESDALQCAVKFIRPIGKDSRIEQTISLSAAAQRLEFHCEVDWHETDRMLKVGFPVNVRAMNATYEMQFGNVERPTHFNSSYDLARYEVPGHKWSDLSEHGFGVALLSESKYGFSTFGNMMRMSLLRSPKAPDPNADMGHHSFSYAIMPHAGGWRDAGVVAEAYRFNCPVLFAGGAAEKKSFATCDDPNLVIDTIKKAEDSDGIIVRLYECHGARGTARVRVDLPYETAAFCNGLEEPAGKTARVRNQSIEVPYAPYKIITLLLK